MQGDGSIDIVPVATADIVYDPSIFVQPTFTIPGQTIDTNPIPPLGAQAEELVFSVFEDVTDGDDYVEGNGGNDRIYGNLGQDDIIGGSSDLFGLATARLMTLSQGVPGGSSFEAHAPKPSQLSGFRQSSSAPSPHGVPARVPG